MILMIRLFITKVIQTLFCKTITSHTAQTFGRATMTHRTLTLSYGDTKEKYDVTAHNYKHFLKNILI